MSFHADASFYEREKCLGFSSFKIGPANPPNHVPKGKAPHTFCAESQRFLLVFFNFEWPNLFWGPRCMGRWGLMQFGCAVGDLRPSAFPQSHSVGCRMGWGHHLLTIGVL